ncbi:hypothetical protein QVA66_05215 [Staphylococcus chromogenes]|nr:hypothetical protein [Staphylococcus chromogenes]
MAVLLAFLGARELLEVLLDKALAFTLAFVMAPKVLGWLGRFERAGKAREALE